MQTTMSFRISLYVNYKIFLLTPPLEKAFPLNRLPCQISKLTIRPRGLNRGLTIARISVQSNKANHGIETACDIVALIHMALYPNDGQINFNLIATLKDAKFWEQQKN